MNQQVSRDGEQKKVLGNWYDTSKQDKAKERRQKKRESRRRRIKRFRWFVVAAIMIAIGVFLLNNFDSFLGREPTVVTYMGRGNPSGFYIYVSDRYERVWLPQDDWDTLRIGNEVVLRETRRGTRVEGAPLSIFQRLFPD